MQKSSTWSSVRVGEPMERVPEAARRTIPRGMHGLIGSSSAFLCTHARRSAGLRARRIGEIRKSSVPLHMHELTLKLPGLHYAHAQWPAIGRASMPEAGSSGAGSRMRDRMLFWVLPLPCMRRPERPHRPSGMFLRAIFITQASTRWHKRLAMTGLVQNPQNSNLDDGWLKCVPSLFDYFTMIYWIGIQTKPFTSTTLGSLQNSKNNPSNPNNQN